jgi:hypothetical protein
LAERSYHHVDTDRGATVQPAAVVHAARRQAHFGHVGEAQAGGVDRQLAQLVQRTQLADGLHAQAAIRLGDLSRRHREVGRRQPLSQSIQIDAVRGDAIVVELDLHLGRGDTGQVDARHARHAFDAPLDLAIEQIVLGLQIEGAGHPDAQHRLVRRAELHHQVALEVRRQLVADRVEAVARIGGGDLDVAVPLELEKDARALGARLRVHPLDAGQSRQRLLGGPRDGFFDLGRAGTRIRQVDIQEGRLDLRQELQRQPEGGDQSNQHHRDEEHAGRHRPLHAQAREAHAPASAAARRAWRSASAAARARSPRSK